MKVLRIQHNQGQFVLNQYNRTNTDLNKTLQKLSSGYQINRAADDAAGLAIGEKMEAQIRGLQQAGNNIEDGISLIQTTEGGLAQIQNPNIQRIRELIIQATNDTNTPEDRALIQKEIDQIVQGIDDIANHTEFNTIPVLTPDREMENQIRQNKFDIVFLIDDSGTMSEEINSVRLGLGTFIQNMGQYGDVNVGTVSVVHENRDLALTGDIDQVINHLNTKHSANGGSTSTYAHLDELLNGNNSVVKFRGDSQKVVVILTDTGNETGTSVTQDALKTKLEAMKVQSYVFGLDFNARGNGFSSDASYTFADAIYKPTTAKEISENLTPGLADIIKENAGIQDVLQKDIIIQAGANEGQQIKIPLYNNRSAALGIANIQIDPYEVAMEGLHRIDIANKIISERRSTYGALQNQLEHAYNNVNNMEINLTDAQSKLKDTDMAKETMKLHKNQVLLQSSQSMMAQINQMGQGILELLK